MVTLSDSTVLLTEETVPTLSIESVAGQLVPENPSGSFPAVDVTFASESQVDIVIEATDIPDGTEVIVTIQNESTGSQVLASTLVGSSTTVTATFSPGFSRILASANWTVP